MSTKKTINKNTNNRTSTVSQFPLSLKQERGGFTANANDTTATDGLEITLSPNGTASITNNEGALTLKDANNQITIAQLTALVLEVNQLKTEVNQLKKTLTANNLALVN